MEKSCCIMLISENDGSGLGNSHNAVERPTPGSGSRSHICALALESRPASMAHSDFQTSSKMLG